MQNEDLLNSHYEKKDITVMLIHSTNINKMNIDHLSP
jgi:hypothetical protein